MKLTVILFLALLFVPGQHVAASTEKELTAGLNTVRNQILYVEKKLIRSMKKRGRTRAKLAKIRELIRLQKEEKKLIEMRSMRLALLIQNLKKRREHIKSQIGYKKVTIKRFLKELNKSMGEAPKGFPLPESEKLQSPRRKVLSRLVNQYLKEVEALKVDLEDSEQLEQKIDQESSQLTYLAEDLKERESLLNFNRGMQVEMLKKNHTDRLRQYEHYRQLKKTELEVEGLITQFNARAEIEKLSEQRRKVSGFMFDGEFSRLKGKLPLPVSGKVVSQFGRHLDPRSRLYVFKKGIDIKTPQAAGVKAVSSGRVVFSGPLSGYGNVVIVDHGGDYYSLCARMSTILKQKDQFVSRGEIVGQTASDGTPLYFEIRSKNVAINPLHWVSI